MYKSSPDLSYCPNGYSNRCQSTATANGVAKYELWQYILHAFNVVRRNVVSDISLGSVLLDIRAHDRWRDLLRYFATAQIRQILPTAYHNNGRVIATDVGCRQLGGSCLCV